MTLAHTTTRSSFVCLSCKLRKKRCDKRLPRCSHCEKCVTSFFPNVLRNLTDRSGPGERSNVATLTHVRQLQGSTLPTQFKRLLENGKSRTGTHNRVNVKPRVPSLCCSSLVRMVCLHLQIRERQSSNTYASSYTHCSKAPMP